MRAKRLGYGVVAVVSVSLATACARGAAVSPGMADSTLTLSGAAAETAPDAHALSAVRVQVTDGPDAGRVAMTDGRGSFQFSGLQPGAIGLVATKDGYLPWRVLNLSVGTYPQIQVVLYPVAPLDGAHVSATARCNDGTWSWEQSEVGLCAAHQGPAYTVCPGPLCVEARK